MKTLVEKAIEFTDRKLKLQGLENCTEEYRMARYQETIKQYILMEKYK